MAAKLKKGDKVIVLAGRDKGKRGEITKIVPAQDKALVGGVNMVKRHTKQSQESQGGIIAKEALIHLSNLAIEDPKDGSPTRVGFKIGKDGKKERFAKKSGDVING